MADILKEVYRIENMADILIEKRYLSLMFFNEQRIIHKKHEFIKVMYLLN